MSAFTKAIRDEFRENPRSTTLAVIGLVIFLVTAIWVSFQGYFWSFLIAVSIVVALTGVRLWAKSADRKKRAR